MTPAKPHTGKHRSNEPQDAPAVWFTGSKFEVNEAAAGVLRKNPGRHYRFVRPAPDEEKAPPSLSEALTSQEDGHLIAKLEAPETHSRDFLVEVINALIDRESPLLEPFLAKTLNNDKLQRPWLDILVYAAENAELRDARHCAAIGKGLLARSIALRDASEVDAEPVLWSALRRYASLVANREAENLLTFLRPEDRRMTRQVALQGLYNILEIEPLTDETGKVDERIRSLAAKYLDTDWVISPENTVMADQVFCLAALAGVAELDDFTERLIALGQVGLVERCHRRLVKAADLRQQVPGHLARCLTRLEQAV